MFEKKTVFVVGAGASKESGLPTGPELADRIARLLHFEFSISAPPKGDLDFYYAIKNHFKDNDSISAHLEAADQISKSVRLVSSIDNYIDIHRHDSRISALGKAAIAYSILDCENRSILQSDPQSQTRKLNLDQFKENWLLHFGRALVSNVPLEAVNSIFQNISIICFNYDRCIEQFLTVWLQSVYGIDSVRSRETVKSLKIIRPYGSISELTTIPFGCTSTRRTIFRHSENIKTYTQQNEDAELGEAMHEAMRSAETIVFLGIAYHPQNMRMLRTNLPWNVERILASAIGFSVSDAQDIKAELHKMTYPRQNSQDFKIEVSNDCTCAKIFTTFSRAFRPAM